MSCRVNNSVIHSRLFMLIVNGHDMVFNGLQWSERPSCLVLFSIAIDGRGHMDGLDGCPLDTWMDI